MQDGTRRFRRLRLRGLALEWQVDPELRPDIRLTVHPDEPVALLHDAVDHGEPQAGAAANLLRGEERLEDLEPRRLLHADAGIAHREQRVLARYQWPVRLGVLLVERHLLRLDGQLSPGRHRVARVDGEVHDDLLELTGV